jgi:hypothetical protein
MADDWRAIFATGNGPVRLLNLLKFRPEVASPDGPVSGAAAYARYAAGTAGAFARAGGERIFFGQIGHMFAFGEAPVRDAAILTRYPSPRALADMWLDTDFITAHENRIHGAERSQVLVFGRQPESLDIPATHRSDGFRFS